MEITLNNLKTKRILITGSKGLLGTALRAKFALLDFKNVLSPSRLQLDLFDLESCNTYFKTNNIDIVIHLAGYVLGLGGNMNNQLSSFEKNSQINHNLLLSISNHKVKKLFFSGTVASYPYPFIKTPLVEEDIFKGIPHEGEFGYSLAKRNAYSHMLLLQKELDLSFTYGVFTNLYGKNDRFNEINGHVIPSLISKAFLAKKKNLPLKVWGSGKSKRDFMYSEDAADIIIQSLEYTNSLVLNIASGKTYSIEYTAKIISDIFDVKKIEFENDKPTGIIDRSVSIEKLSNLSKIKFTPLQKGLEETCKWYQNNINYLRV